MKDYERRKTRRSIPQRPKHVGSCTDLHWRLWSWVSRSETWPCWPCSWPQWGDAWQTQNQLFWSLKMSGSENHITKLSQKLTVTNLFFTWHPNPADSARVQTPFFEAPVRGFPSGFMLISISYRNQHKPTITHWVLTFYNWCWTLLCWEALVFRHLLMSLRAPRITISLEESWITKRT